MVLLSTTRDLSEDLASSIVQAHSRVGVISSAVENNSAKLSAAPNIAAMRSVYLVTYWEFSFAEAMPSICRAVPSTRTMARPRSVTSNPSQAQPHLLHAGDEHLEDTHYRPTLREHGARRSGRGRCLAWPSSRGPGVGGQGQ
jgi:hypothetical protein